MPCNPTSVVGAVQNNVDMPTAESTYTLSFPQLARQIPALASETLFQSARRSGLRIVGACGGRGTCRSCTVRIVKGEVEPHHGTGRGAALAEAHADPQEWVQACLVSARSDCTVEVAPRSLARVLRAGLDSGAGDILALAPAVHSRDIILPEATLTDNLADADRVARALGTPIEIDVAAARQLPALIRDGGWRVRVRLRGGELIGANATGRRALGLAVDLGTTNAAAFLVDLEGGRGVASLAIENPQVAWGGDVISRVNAAVRSAGAADDLRQSACGAIDALAHDLCRTVGAAVDDIVDVAICGNTAMQHLLLGLPVASLGRAPFVAVLRAGIDLKARDVGIHACPGAYVHVAPNVGGFVGGDHVAALLATEAIWQTAATSVVMDIGTNTEISLIHRGRFLTASAPSGPALEGGHISCGMRAAEGAIERVRLGTDGRIAIAVIGDGPAVGLCGSGVLDAVAALHRAGALDDRGRLSDDHADVGETDGRRFAVLAPGVHLTQHDIRAVQLAKAAVRAAVQMLLQQAGLHATDIERFIIAGAFGAYIDVDAGVATGLFPDLPRERFAQVGNAAGVGVRQMLASTHARGRAEALAAGCRHVELSALAGFQKCFLKHIGFPANLAPTTSPNPPRVALPDTHQRSAT